MNESKFNADQKFTFESKSDVKSEIKIDEINVKKILHDIRNLIPLNHEKITAIKKFPPEDLIEIILVYDSILNALADLLNN
jgi:hypothetical protein